jgi:hypothetical protein
MKKVCFRNTIMDLNYPIHVVSNFNTNYFRMNKILPLLICLLLFVFGNHSIKAQSSSKLVEFCAASAGDDATYLKDFVVELEAAGADGKAPEQRFTMVLSKNTEYRFTACNADGSPGKAIIQLYDMNQKYGSNYSQSTGQMAQSFGFQCSKTGAYHLIITFLDGKKGSAVAIVSFVKTL